MGKMAQNDTFEWFSPQILADLAGFGVDLGGVQRVTTAGVETERNVAHMPNCVPQKLRPKVGG